MNGTATYIILLDEFIMRGDNTGLSFGLKYISGLRVLQPLQHQKCYV